MINWKEVEDAQTIPYCDVCSKTIEFGSETQTCLLIDKAENTKYKAEIHPACINKDVVVLYGCDVCTTDEATDYDFIIGTDGKGYTACPSCSWKTPTKECLGCKELFEKSHDEKGSVCFKCRTKALTRKCVICGSGIIANEKTDLIILDNNGAKSNHVVHFKCVDSMPVN